MDNKTIIDYYFNTLIFSKVDVIDTANDSFMVYAAKIVSDSMMGSRFCILIVPLGPYPEKVRSSEVPWVSIQTRVQDGNKYGKLSAQRWVVPRNATDVNLSVFQRTDKYTKYRATPNDVAMDPRLKKWLNPSFNYEIILLHDPKKKSIYQFRNNTTLMIAIDSFSMVISKLRR